MGTFTICAIIITAILFCGLSYLIGSFEGFTKGYKKGYEVKEVSQQSLLSLIRKQDRVINNIFEQEEKKHAAKHIKKVYPSYLKRIK
jgi:hypothetical protein